MSLNKRHFGKTLLTVALAIAVAMTMVPFQMDAHADSLKSVRNQKKNVYSKMNRLAAKMEKKENSMNKLQKKIDKKQAEAEKTEEEIEKTKKKIEDRKEKLGLRVRAMYKTGAVGYMDIILSSRSFSEVVSNAELVKKIYTADRDALNDVKEQKEKLSDQQAKLKEQKADLKAQQKTVKEQKEDLEKDAKELKSQYSKLREREEKIERKLQRKLAKAAAASAAASGSSSGSSSSGGSSYSGGSGTLAWPCSGTITTEFGTRRSWDPYSKAHSGMDIAVGYGTPIHAAAAGTVIIAGTYGGYGNCVAIRHSNGLVTLYGHNSSLTTSVGQHVSRGDVIAKAGSTGFSTGVHCHFEVQVGGTPVNPRNYL